MKVKAFRGSPKAFIGIACVLFMWIFTPLCYSWKIEKATGPQELPKLTQPAKPSSEAKLSSQQLDKAKQQLIQELYKPSLDYSLFVKLPDPFVPFIKPATEEALEHATLEELLPPEPIILTPLQKMDISEIERGFKGTLWGPHGRKAIIEDSTGKGYIVDIGTRIGNQDGIVTAILKDKLIVRQKVWNRKKRNFVYQEVVIRLRKGT